MGRQADCSVVSRLAKGLSDIKGLSASNLKYCLRFFQFYTGGQGASAPEGAAATLGQQPVDQLPWGHNILMFTPRMLARITRRTVLQPEDL